MFGLVPNFQWFGTDPSRLGGTSMVSYSIMTLLPQAFYYAPILLPFAIGNGMVAGRSRSCANLVHMLFPSGSSKTSLGNQSKLQEISEWSSQMPLHMFDMIFHVWSSKSCKRRKTLSGQRWVVPSCRSACWWSQGGWLGDFSNTLLSPAMSFCISQQHFCWRCWHSIACSITYHFLAHFLVRQQPCWFHIPIRSVWWPRSSRGGTSGSIAKLAVLVWNISNQCQFLRGNLKSRRFSDTPAVSSVISKHREWSWGHSSCLSSGTCKAILTLSIVFATRSIKHA